MHYISCLLDQFCEAQPGMMLHMDSQDKYKLFQTFDGQVL